MSLWVSLFVGTDNMNITKKYILAFICIIGKLIEVLCLNTKIYFYETDIEVAVFGAHIVLVTLYWNKTGNIWKSVLREYVCNYESVPNEFL